MRNPQNPFLFGLGCLLLALGGCTTPPEPEAYQPPPPFARDILVQDGTNLVDTRTGWTFPTALPSVGLVSAQAWEYQNRIIGIEYRTLPDAVEIAMTPLRVPESAFENGSVTINAYPAGYAGGTVPSAIPFSGVVELTGLGYGRNDPEEEFWGYQETLEDAHYNMWKLLRFVDAQASDNVFHSLLVLKKLSSEKSDAIVLAVGRVGEVHMLVTVRKYIRSREELDAFGRWAYEILTELGLSARQAAPS